MARAKTVVHVEYEALNLILSQIDVSELHEDMVPHGDDVAEKRFKTGVGNVAKLVQNLIDRRLHRLPSEHPDYRGKA